MTGGSFKDPKCQICEKPLLRRKDIRVDHDHKTDKARGILCNSCNVGLGFFRDDPKLLKRAAQYLAAHTETAKQGFTLEQTQRITGLTKEEIYRLDVGRFYSDIYKETVWEREAIRAWCGRNAALVRSRKTSSPLSDLC